MDNPPGAVIGYGGFFSGDSPDSVWIMVPSTPAEDLPWLVAHEIGHAAYYHYHGADGSLPTERGPSEVFADAPGDEYLAIEEQGGCVTVIAGLAHVPRDGPRRRPYLDWSRGR